jgi:hypothetical protein
MNETTADDISVFFLAQGEQQADTVMARLAAYIAAARKSLERCTTCGSARG